MQLYFIRHAQSENNWLFARTGSFDGRHEDPGITHLGQQQARYLAQALRQPGREPVPQRPTNDPQNVRGFGFTHLYCSLMLRAVATGVILSQALDLPLVAWEEAHEMGGIHRRNQETGDHTGLPGPNRAFFETHYPDLVLPDSLGEEGWWDRPYEEREERPARARRFLADLLDRHGSTEDRVALISHGGFYSQLVQTVLDMAPAPGYWFSLNNTGITRIDFDPEYTWLQYANRLDHLPRNLIT